MDRGETGSAFICCTVRLWSHQEQNSAVPGRLKELIHWGFSTIMFWSRAFKEHKTLSNHTRIPGCFMLRHHVTGESPQSSAFITLSFCWEAFHLMLLHSHSPRCKTSRRRSCSLSSSAWKPVIMLAPNGQIKLLHSAASPASCRAAKCHIRHKRKRKIPFPL